MPETASITGAIQEAIAPVLDQIIDKQIAEYWNSPDFRGLLQQRIYSRIEGLLNGGGFPANGATPEPPAEAPKTEKPVAQKPQARKPGTRKPATAKKKTTARRTTKKEAAIA